MAHGKIQSMIAAKTAAGHGDLRSPVLPLQIRHKFIEQIAFILQVAPDARPRMHAFVIPTLAVDAVDAEDLDRSAFHPSSQSVDHTCVLVFKETPLGSGKNQEGLAGVTIDEQLHVTA